MCTRFFSKNYCQTCLKDPVELSGEGNFRMGDVRQVTTTRSVLRTIWKDGCLAIIHTLWALWELFWTSAVIISFVTWHLRLPNELLDCKFKINCNSAIAMSLLYSLHYIDVNNWVMNQCCASPWVPSKAWVSPPGESDLFSIPNVAQT